MRCGADSRRFEGCWTVLREGFRRCCVVVRQTDQRTSVLVGGRLGQAGNQIVLQMSSVWVVARLGLCYGRTCWGYKPIGIASASGWVAARMALGIGRQSWFEGIEEPNFENSAARG